MPSLREILTENIHILAQFPGFSLGRDYILAQNPDGMICVHENDGSLRKLSRGSFSITSYRWATGDYRRPAFGVPLCILPLASDRFTSQLTIADVFRLHPKVKKGYIQAYQIKDNISSITVFLDEPLHDSFTGNWLGLSYYDPRPLQLKETFENERVLQLQVNLPGPKRSSLASYGGLSFKDFCKGKGLIYLVPEMPSGEKPMKIEETLKVYATVVNSDLTEGRGRQIALCYCESPVIARRLGRGKNVQGSNGEVKEVELFKVDGRWHSPLETVYITPMSSEDKVLEKEQLKKEEVKEKARSLGLTEDEIEQLKTS